MERSKRKTVISSISTLAVLAVVLALVFRGQSKQILQCLLSVSPWSIVLLIILALGCPLLEAAGAWLAFRTQTPKLSFGQALTVTFLNIFGNVATMGAGSVPLQSWYLSFYGLLPGVGAGLATLCYALQKTVVLLYATAMLIYQGRWLRSSNLNLSRYLLLGYTVCALIILALLLICTWEKIQRLLLWGISKLPDTGKWPERKVSWRENVEGLRSQSKMLLANRSCCAWMMLLYAGKFFLLYTVSYCSIRFLGFDQLSFWQVQLISAVMVLITNAIPNIGGAGPAEFAFTMLYAPYLGAAGAASAMVLYRTASYFFPFLVSILFALHFQHLVRNKSHQAESREGNGKINGHIGCQLSTNTKTRRLFK